MIQKEQFDLWCKRYYAKIRSAVGKRKTANNYYVNTMEYIDVLYERTQKNKDGVTGISGERGSGKTSFAIGMGLCLKEKGLEFDMTNIFYGQKYLREAVEKIVTTRSNVFIFDEMIDFAFSREAMTAQNRIIHKIITKARKMNHVVFMCIPTFKDLDRTVRNDCHFWVHSVLKSEAKSRDERFAVAALMGKDLNALTPDPWGLDDYKMAKKRIYDPYQQLRFLSKLRSHLANLAYPILPKVIEDEYEVLSREALAFTGGEFLKTLKTQNVDTPPTTPPSGQDGGKK